MHGNTTHGMKNTRPYNVWISMKTRCFNKNHHWFKCYGGRGITVCDKWLNFTGFWEDMQAGYSDELTLDRIDPNGNYCKENCRWATKLQQSRNARNNVFVEYQGQTKLLQEWAEEKKMPYPMLYARLFKYGWKVEDIFLPKGISLKKPRKRKIHERNTSEWLVFGEKARKASKLDCKGGLC